VPEGQQSSDWDAEWRELGLPGPPPNGNNRLTWFGQVLFLNFKQSKENTGLLHAIQAGGCAKLPMVRREMRRERWWMLAIGFCVGAVGGAGGSAGVLQLLKTLF